MAQLTINIPDNIVQRVLDGIAPLPLPEGVTQVQAAKKTIIAFIKEKVREAELRNALAAAETASSLDIT